MNRVAAATAREATRQQALLQALFAAQPTLVPAPELGVSQRAQRWAAGLAAYRGNGLEHAVAALRAQFPTLLAMLGEAPFAVLCARYWYAYPPRQGDLARIGAELADCIAALDDLRAWPWLADSARLDWARWAVVFDAPAQLAAADLQRLAECDPARLQLRLAPGTRLLHTHWPVLALWRAHQLPDIDADVLHAALQTPAAPLWVWREDMQAQCRELSTAEADWLQALRAGGRLDQALEAAAEDFDVGAWLQAAVQHGWIDGIEIRAEASTPA
ncbi:HvfC/BufC family peptide modification chaperone [Metallibacterium scheffleri]